MDSNAILKLTEKIYKGQYNTISAAYSVLALGEYSKLLVTENGELALEFASINADNKRKILNAVARPFLSADYDVGVAALNVSAGTGLYYTNVQSGFDQQFPKQAIKQGLEISREFVNEQGAVITQGEQGSEVTVRLKVRSLDEAQLSNVAIVDLLPGGFVVNRNSVSDTAVDWRADYVDLREDRVVFYGSFTKQVTELSYKAKLTSSGSFVIPPTYAESMYDRSVRAITTAGKFNVIAAP